MIKSSQLRTFIASVAFAAAASGAAQASLNTLSLESATDFISLPLTSVEIATPLVMLTLSRDHQLFYKAYNDYSDLTGDGNPDTTYNHDFDYYGYFDPYKCYTYVTGNNNNFYRPQRITADKYCGGNNEWSGNFLNWVTTSRMDAVRKLLYGGLRSVDSNTQTILDRAHLPQDAHSWAKFYNGSDIRQLTPFNPPTTIPTATVNNTTLTFSTGDKSLTLPNNHNMRHHIGDQIRLQARTGDTSRFMVGTINQLNGNNGIRVHVIAGAFQGSGNATSWTVSNLSATGISFCNTTSHRGNNQNLSHNNTNPPLLKVVQGNFELWNANEVWQCEWFEDRRQTINENVRSNGNNAHMSGLNASGENPKQSNGNANGSANRQVHALGSGSAAGEFNVRVEVCRNTDLIGTERCKAYGENPVVLKPIGLLQLYGDDDRIRFGLVTPSYDRNISGGVVRSNIGPMTREVSPTTGRFISTTAGAEGIINTLNRIRIYGYNFAVNDAYGNGDGCSYQRTRIVRSGRTGQQVLEGNCSSWGNPMSEAYLESLRYMAGANRTAAFVPPNNNRDNRLGLPNRTWEDPLSNDNYCAPLNALIFNASVITYDNELLGGISDLGSNETAQQWTNRVGQEEGIAGQQWFIGSAEGSTDGMCSAKTINNFGQAHGICPEVPVQSGSYNMAGIAAYAHRNRIRDDLDVPDNDTGSLKVNTYGIALATATPRIIARHPDGSGRSVTILPAYRLNVGNEIGTGTLVDFRIIEQNEAAGTGRFYVNWEDSEQGGDYDQDVWGTLEYRFDGNRILVTTNVVSSSTSEPQGFGYVISGTTQDGPHFHSGILGFTFTDPLNISVTPTTNLNASGGCQNCQNNNLPTTAAYTLGAPAASLLEDPLYYAAKYGGPVDPVTDEPQNFFYVTNPARLEESLAAAFDAIVARTASGTAAAVVANAREGEGAAYQALYEPKRVDADGREVRWIGNLHALFIDDDGFLREDFTGNGVLGARDVDPVVEIFFDEAERTTRFRRYFGNPQDTVPTLHPLADLRPIWSAADRLGTIASATTQRGYNQSAAQGRHILTWVDRNRNGQVNANEVLPFVPSTFTQNGNELYGLLNVSSPQDATRLVNWVRGADQDGLRSRQLRVPLAGGGSALRTMRMADIIHSTPTVVSAPAEAFDLLYDDASYGVFRERYRNRRNVVYVGSNGGMLHAFNAGFYDAENKAFTLSGSSSEVPHPLGSELWSFVPQEILPHLPWLVSDDYAHISFVDGKPRVFDARIFSPSDRNPDGWGTVLIMGLRFGGGSVTLPTTGANANAFRGFSNAGNQIRTRPTYVMLDITDPESPPAFIASISHPEMGYTTALPAVVAVGQRGAQVSVAAGTNDWYLVFGDGPDNLNANESSTNGRFFVYDLTARDFVSGWGPRTLTEAPGSFVGDPVVVDWDLDFKADNIYFGTVSGGAEEPGGKLYRISLGDNDSRTPDAWSAPEVMVDPQRPLISTPAVTFDESGNRWVFAGTGRFYSEPDKASTANQMLFGVIDEPSASGSTPQSRFNALVDTSAARVATNGLVEGISGGVSNESDLMTSVRSAGGWRLRMPVPVAAERSLSPLSLFGDILFASVFTPSTNLCGGEGQSRLFGLYFKTGAARSDIPAFGTDDWIVDGETRQEARSVIDIGPGLAASPSLHLGTARDSRGLTIFTQTSTGAIERREATVTEGARSGEIDWRERR